MKMNSLIDAVRPQSHFRLQQHLRGMGRGRHMQDPVTAIRRESCFPAIPYHSREKLLKAETVAFADKIKKMRQAGENRREAFLEKQKRRLEVKREHCWLRLSLGKNAPLANFQILLSIELPKRLVQSFGPTQMTPSSSHFILPSMTSLAS